MRAPAISTPPNTPNQSGGIFAALRRMNGVMNATNDELDAIVSSGERLAGRCALLIVAALVAEAILVFVPLSDFGTKITDFIANSLIAAGVFGELFFHKRSSHAQSELQRRAVERIAELSAQTAAANERAATLEKEAAHARARTAEIERLTAWRRITFEQKEAIVRAIDHKMPAAITIECVFDPEAIRFADELRDLFFDANVRAERLARPMPTDGSLEFGLMVASDPSVHAVVLKEAFQNAGIQISKLAAAAGGAPRLTLYVGHNPAYRERAFPRESSI